MLIVYFTFTSICCTLFYFLLVQVVYLKHFTHVASNTDTFNFVLYQQLAQLIYLTENPYL